MNKSKNPPSRPEGVAITSEAKERVENFEELTEEEREKFAQLLKFVPSKYSDSYNKFIRELRNMGTKTTAYLLEKIHSEEDTLSIFDLVDLLSATATDQDAQKVGSLLELPSITLTADRSGKSRVLEILNRIGTTENIPHLKKFAEMAINTDYEGRWPQSKDKTFNVADIVNAINVLYYIKNTLGDKDIESKEEIDEAVEYMRDIIENNSSETLTTGELKRLSLMSDRKVLVDRFEQQVLGRKDLFNLPPDDPFDDVEHMDELDDPFGYSDPDYLAKINSQSAEDDGWPDYSFDSPYHTKDGETFSSLGANRKRNEREDSDQLRALRSLLETLAVAIGDRNGSAEEYTFFKRPVEREELYFYCKKLAEHLHDAEIPNLVVVDRSSRPVYIGVKEYWRYKYPNEIPPNIYFMNPYGFKTVDEKNEFKVRYDGGAEIKKTQNDVDELFEKTYKKLILDKDKPVLVFDSCIHSGDTLAPLERTMKSLGFSQLQIGSINPSDDHSKVETDYFITTDRPNKGCYPFDRDRMIEKVFYSLHSERSTDMDDVDRAIVLRKEIKKIMQEKIQEEEATW